MSDLDLARARRLILALEAAAEERAELALLREARDYQQAKGGFPDRVDLGGGVTATLKTSWSSGRASSS